MAMFQLTNVVLPWFINGHNIAIIRLEHGLEPWFDNGFSMVIPWFSHEFFRRVASKFILVFQNTAFKSIDASHMPV